MALDAGITMSECRVFEEGGRAHFMTRRFDRAIDNRKIHMQSLCGLAHLDYQMPGSYGYEQAFSVIQRLGLGYPVLSEMFRRMVFNIAARNQDDHTRNIAFLMNDKGEWSLAPAFDVMWAYNPEGVWTSLHQMSVRGKRDGFSHSDLMAVAEEFGIRDGEEIIQHVLRAVGQWPEYAIRAGVPPKRIAQIGSTHRLSLMRP
jgi:serine/threonine-protein kinase HipA